MEAKVQSGNIAHYERKLEYEIDSWDLWDAIGRGEDIVVVDARGADSHAKEHIPGAISFPHRTMNEDSAAKLRRDCLYVTYCDGIGCNASTKGALKLARLGFRVKEMIGGISWWKRDGYATEGEQGVAGTPLRCGC